MEEEEKKSKWTDYLAITTVIIAVCATLSTFKGGGYSNQSLLNQTKASDQWSFYQSKSMKGYIFEMQKDNFSIQRSSIEKTASPDLLSKYDAKLSEYDKKIAQYEKDKADIKQKATEFEKERDDCKAHGNEFGIAVIFLQISILLSSIAALSKKKRVWYFGLLVGILGIVYFVNGFFLFF
jgi:hypothetical protein